MPQHLSAKAHSSAASRWKIARSFPRFGLALPLEVSAPRFSAPLTARMIDIGLGGMCASLPPGSLHPGDRINLRFKLPQASEPMNILAKVRYCAEDRHGFQFLSITPLQRELIRQACRNLVIV